MSTGSPDFVDQHEWSFALGSVPTSGSRETTYFNVREWNPTTGGRIFGSKGAMFQKKSYHLEYNLSLILWLLQDRDSFFDMPCQNDVHRGKDFSPYNNQPHLKSLRLEFVARITVSYAQQYISLANFSKHRSVEFQGFIHLHGISWIF